MAWRLLSFVLCQALTALAVWLFTPGGVHLVGLIEGALLGSYLWWTLDAIRGARVLRWLRVGDSAGVPLGTGLWGEVLDRIRKQLRLRERAATESEARLQEFLAALQASPNGVVLLDAQGRIEWFNQTASSHFGFDARRDMLQHFGNLVRDPAFAGYFNSGDYGHDVLMMGRESSATKPVRLSVNLHPYGEGRSLLLSRDVTALEQAETMRRDFVANVSHEIRTPLTVLAGFVETLQTLPIQSEDRQRYLALMSQQAERMQSLVHDVLTLSRLEGSPLPPLSDWIPTSALLAQCIQDGQDLSTVLWGQSRKIVLLDSPVLEIAGSATELMSAMSNMLVNAIRYTPPETPIELQWELRSDEGATFSVQDHGPGIAPEHLPRLTERFYRIDRSRSRETGGTGLGLAIVKHVSQRHGGELLIESVPGKGSRFAMALPAQRVREAVALKGVEA